MNPYDQSIFSKSTMRGIYSAFGALFLKTLGGLVGMNDSISTLFGVAMGSAYFDFEEHKINQNQNAL